MRVVVLRLGHRPERDKRITTHVGLVARAFGADEMVLVGRDDSVLNSLSDVVDRWGGEFRLRSVSKWRGEINHWKESGGKVVHLTMYGSNLPDVIHEIKSCDQIMVVLGAEKVPAELYELADWNVAVGNQPHSEVAALAVFMDRLLEGKGLEMDFDGKLQIHPSRRGKKVIEQSSENALQDE
jgi:tRNA (cytidine56-2'-O)-methyltransferase